MAKFTLEGYNSYSGCDIVVTAKFNVITGANKKLEEKVYTLGSLQTLSISTHQDKKPVRVIGSVNALDYTMGQRTIAGSLVFAVFDQHFATEMFRDLGDATGKTFLLPDELPGLDLTISFANEYGRQSRMAVYGVRIINEGQVMSINDLYTENTYQFVATAMEPLSKDTISGIGSSINKNVQIESSISNETNVDLSKGEDIFSKLDLNDENKVNRVNLTAKIENPNLLNQLGMATFTLYPKQVNGTIYISDERLGAKILEFKVLESLNQYTAYLKPGIYSAWYDNSELTSNTETFTIEEVLNIKSDYNDTPTIENVTDSMIVGISNNPTHSIAVCIDKETKETITCDISARSFKFENLQGKEYSVFTEAFGLVSKSIDVIMISKARVSEYKNYVINNQNLLSKNITAYEDILNKLKDDDFIYTLMKENNNEARELLFMAIKYKNEFVSSINSFNMNNSAVKDISNVFGNSFKFNSGIAKANIFTDKDKKSYFKDTIVQPVEVNYLGLANTLYSVIGINKSYIKSPKYYFYNYADNYKAGILKQFGKVDVLNQKKLVAISNSKLSVNSLKCLTAKQYKHKPGYGIIAPNGYIDEDLNTVIYTNYEDVLGSNAYCYICFSKLNECLDSTPFRKIRFNTSEELVVINKYDSAINDKDTFTIWIEDENYNIISDLGFISYSSQIGEVQDYIIETEIEKILRKLERDIQKPNFLSDLVVDYDINMKDIYKEIAMAILSQKTSYSHELIYFLYKIRAYSFWTNSDTFKSATIDNKNSSVTFNNATDSQLVHIAIKKDNCLTTVTHSNQAFINEDYDVNIFYLIGKNTAVKSGFVMVDCLGNRNSYLIDLEVV